MTKATIEERIDQIAQKKRVLDHLIIERLEEEEIDPVTEAIRALKTLKKGITLGKKLSVRKLIEEGRK